MTMKITTNNTTSKSGRSSSFVFSLWMFFGCCYWTTTTDAFIITPPSYCRVKHQKRTFVSNYRNLPNHSQTDSNKKNGIKLSMSSSASTIITIAETLAPKIGVVTSTALYFSPTKAVLRALRMSQIQDLNPFPLAIMSMSSIAWLVYGLSIGDPYIVLSNIFGCIGSIFFIVGILPLIDRNESEGDTNSKQKLFQTQLALVLGSSCILSLWTYLSLTFTTMTRVSSSLGYFASALFCVLAASPLSTIGSVLRTKNASSILGAFTAAQVTNCSLWTAYGLAIKDIFVWGPNAIGLFLGFVQLALKVLFPSSNKNK